VFVLESLTTSTSTFHFRLHLRGHSCWRAAGQGKGAGGSPSEEQLLDGPPAYCVQTVQPGHGGGAIVLAPAEGLQIERLVAPLARQTDVT
jgi:hypothetical protein